MKEQEGPGKETDLDPINGAANADCVKANIITRRNVNILVDTATCVAVTKVLSVVEEEEEETGTPAMGKMKGTGTKTRNSGDQKATTKPTRKQVIDKEHQEKHSGSKQTAMEGTAPPTPAPTIPITGAIVSHLTMTEGILTPEEATE